MGDGPGGEFVGGVGCVGLFEGDALSWTVFISDPEVGLLVESRICCMSSPCNPFFSRKETFSTLVAFLMASCDSHRFAFSSRLLSSSWDCAVSVGALVSDDILDCAPKYVFCQSGMLLLDGSAMSVQ